MNNPFSKTNKLTPWSSIQMKADKKTAELNISGYIGIPEWWQFDPDMEKELISTKEKMQKELKEISNLKVDTIKINIDSLGGDVNHGQAIYSALLKNPANIEVEYTGWSASIATIIAASATDNNISMSETNMILIHQGRGCQCGVANDMRVYADWLDKINDTMSNVYAKQTGNKQSEIMALMSVNSGNGEWLTAAEAKEIGLIKNITQQLKAAANYDLKRLKEFGYSVPQNKLNEINMFKFGKKESPINTLALQDGTILLHEGDLEVGSEMQKAGENVELKGEHITADGQKIVIDENNKVTSIEAKQEPEEVTLENVVEVIGNMVADKLIEAEQRINASFDKKIEALRKGGSTHKVNKINIDSSAIEIGTQEAARSGVQATMDEIYKQKLIEKGITTG